MLEEILNLNENIDAVVFYGINNSNIQIIKNLFPNLQIIARGHSIKVSGNQKEIDKFLQKFSEIEDFCLKRNVLTEDNILNIVKGNQIAENEQIDNLILYGAGGKTIIAKSPNQQKLVEKFAENDLLFAIGPAGSGKTYTAIALAVKYLKNKEVRKIILSRPAVEAGEKLGFLPGDMKDKIDPYLQPLYDALQDMLQQQKLQEFMTNGTIQIAPLAFMRGRTLNDAVVILDEAQNTSIEQIKMFLTRLGVHSKMIVTGDLTQIDLPPSQKSGLKDAIAKLQNIKGIAIIEFDKGDIVRHSLVQKIVEAYEKG